MHAVRDRAEDTASGGKSRGQSDGLQQRHRAGGDARVRRGLAAHRAKTRHGGQQLLRVGVGGGGKQLAHRRLFLLFAMAHDDHLIRHFRDHGHVMRDEDHRHAQFGLQLADGVEDLRLNGDIQRRCRLVRDQQLRAARQRHGNHHALAHPARQLVRMLSHHVRRIGDADLFQHLQRDRLGFGTGNGLVHQDGFNDLAPDAEHRVQRGHWLLKDHCDFGAANLAHPFGRRLHQIQRAAAALELHGTCVDAPAGKVGQPHDGACAH